MFKPENLILFSSSKEYERNQVTRLKLPESGIVIKVGQEMPDI
jgi:hypothetical protein